MKPSLRAGWVAAGLAAVTVAALVVGGGDATVMVGPVLLVGLAFVLASLPARSSLLLVTFLALTLENPSEIPAQGRFRTPLYPLGAVLLTHLNLTFPSARALIFSGLDVVLVLLAAVALFRRSSRARTSGLTASHTGPLRTLAVLVLAATAWLWVWGMVRGDADAASGLWQVQRVVYIPLLLFLFDDGLRPADAPAVGKVIVAAACVRAALALYIVARVPPLAGPTEGSYATTHADSMLFASALCIVVVAMLERQLRTLRGVAVAALLVGGMLANDRRIVWVEVAAALGVALTLSPSSTAKRVLRRTALVTSPLMFVYCAAGWSSDGGVFRPLHMVRSVVDSSSDGSTSWRDWENYDLCYTIRENPILGTGWGHGYDELVKLPDVSKVYGLYRFAPHNGLLGLWAYGGLLGFFALWTLLPAGVFLAVRAHSHARTPGERVASLSAAGAIVVHSVHCYGDTGLGSWTSIFTVVPALTVAGQLAAATGAWSRGPAGGQSRG
jgi:hypothetical protein